MCMNPTRGVAMALVALSTGPIALAGVAGETYISQPPDQINAVFSDSSEKSLNPFERRADVFSVTQESAAVRTINFWGVYFNDQPFETDEFTVRIYSASEDKAIPLEQVFFSRFSAIIREETGEIVADLVKEYAYVGRLGNAFFPVAGEEYWLSITNNDTGTGESFLNSWLWTTSSSGDGRDSVSFDGGFEWAEDDQGDLAFELSSIPAPGSAALLGVAGLAGLRRRR